MQRLPTGMENVPTRTLTIHPAADWLASAGAFMGRVRMAVRAFGEALHKEPVRSRPRARGERAAEPAARRPSPWMEPGELPETYDRTKVVAMVISPYLVHVYWDLSAKDQARSGPGCLRFHGATAGGSFDVSVDLAARNWYVHLWSPEKRYSVELGVQKADAFQPLARSNPIETPRAWPAAEVAQISEPPRQAPRVEVRQAVEPPVQTVSVPAAPAVATPPLPPKSLTPESAFPSPRPHTPQAPGNAVETLRRRLSELYGFYRWPRPVPPAPEDAAPESTSTESATFEQCVVPQPPESAAPAIRGDFTARLEAQFSPGLSSGLLQEPKPRG